MSKTAQEYAEQCLGLQVPKSALKDTLAIFQDVPALRDQLSDPTFPLERKNDIIDRIVPMAARELLKLLCANGQLELLEDICQRYQSMEQKKSGKFYVTLRYVTPPTDTQLEDIKKFVAHRYGDEQDVVFDMVEDASLVSGFKLTAGNEEYDWSAKGRLAQLEQKLTGLKAASTQAVSYTHLTLPTILLV